MVRCYNHSTTKTRHKPQADMAQQYWFFNVKTYLYLDMLSIFPRYFNLMMQTPHFWHQFFLVPKLVLITRCYCILKPAINSYTSKTCGLWAGYSHGSITFIATSKIWFYGIQNKEKDHLFWFYQTNYGHLLKVFNQIKMSTGTLLAAFKYPKAIPIIFIRHC